ncbi:Na(+)/H(+) exchange regulatory cofactor NHE-RF1 isoform X1 [Synchiropus splendidus]|uniref:Na(+)/H(+) exchange regulatory cofactor NHE-RF1 isoform X1 n=1 Tax=Synchiropus splendidus TaxID=270530 RepID=UPI00237D5005|nr:Na(+)/H(+) exchange regulatory cofactor NHE-RF1 isoform X1 [Synchiropus splendidus]
MPSQRQLLRPRLCSLDKGENGYGFHLHGEKGKSGQFIRLVEPDSPAESSGLRAGDRLLFVNGDDVESESHQQVVSRIRATAGSLELIVVDPDTELLLRKHNLKCSKEFVSEGLPLPFEDEEEAEEEEVNGTEEPGPDPQTDPPQEPEAEPEVHRRVEKKLSGDSNQEVSAARRPRLCVIQRDTNGYGFNLHSERARPGQYIRAVDQDSPAERAGLQPKDRIIQVNGVPVEGKTHSEVVAAIKAGGHEARLLVVDPEVDAFFKRCGVSPTSDHMTGPLPEPGVNGAVAAEEEEKVNGSGAQEAQRDSKLSVSPSPSNASSNASLTTPPASTPPEVGLCLGGPRSQPDFCCSAPQGVVTEAIPALTLSLQQVKELAHQKRSNKRAPPMDWSKKNELFSNL